MVKFKKFFLIIFVLPLALIVDFVLYALTKNCVNCGSFLTFLESEGALSFPIIVSLGDYVTRVFNQKGKK